MIIDFISAFTIGLLGAGHCIGMCGGITSMLTAALDKESQKKTLYVFAYNIGRVFSYGILGSIAGLTGSLAVKSLGLPIISLKFIAGTFLILLGLYIGQWLFLLNHVEKIGKSLWRLIQPFSKRLIPVNSVTKAMGLGVLWGWLPCGLIYSTLTWAVASGSPLHGFIIMFSFGLGTLPALLIVSFGFKQLSGFFRQKLVRSIIAISLIIYGIFTLKIAYMMAI